MYKAAFIYLGTEHAEFKNVQPALSDRGVKAELIHLDAVQQVTWQDYDFVSLRMCRGLHLDADFIRKVSDLSFRLQSIKDKNIPLCNSLMMVKAGIDKAVYLKALEQQGIDIIPTQWISIEEKSIKKIMAERGWNKVILKPTISTLSWQTFYIEKRGEDFVISAPEYQDNKPFADNCNLTETAGVKPHVDPEQVFQQLTAENDLFMVQKFMPNILTQGEVSFVFIDGVFSHAVKKIVADGGWVAHELFGGKNTMTRVSQQDERWATKVYKKITDLYGELLYGRVDAIADEQGDLKLLECELIVPRLFLNEGQAVDRYADAILKQIEKNKNIRNI